LVTDVAKASNGCTDVGIFDPFSRFRVKDCYNDMLLMTPCLRAAVHRTFCMGGRMALHHRRGQDAEVNGKAIYYSIAVVGPRDAGR